MTFRSHVPFPPMNDTVVPATLAKSHLRRRPDRTFPSIGPSRAFFTSCYPRSHLPHHPQKESCLPPEQGGVFLLMDRSDGKVARDFHRAFCVVPSSWARLYGTCLRGMEQPCLPGTKTESYLFLFSSRHRIAPSLAGAVDCSVARQCSGRGVIMTFSPHCR